MRDGSGLSRIFAPEAPDARWRWTERHLQCVWADAALRPARLAAASGAEVRVSDPGEWNLGAGPDFLGAVVEIGGATRRGDVEIHVRRGDWAAHRHGADPLYAGVILHVTWFPPPAGALPAPPHGTEEVPLRDALLAKPGFSLDAVDVGAYPHAAPPGPPRPCGEALLGASSAEKTAVLRAAGMARLRRKAARMAERVAETGDAARVFYEEVFAALGYKRNSAQMRRLAQLMPEAGLCTAGGFMERYAVLLGLSGLLPGSGAGALPAASRALWDAAWKLGCAAPAEALACDSAGRPANRPRARLAAAAALFGGAPGALLAALMRVPRGASWGEGAAAALLDAVKAFSQQPCKPALGAERANTIVANAAAPLLLATGAIDESACPSLPAEAPNAQARDMARRLFGRDRNPALYCGDGVLTQGLVEIWNGFCLPDKSLCAACPFAAALHAAFSG